MPKTLVVYSLNDLEGIAIARLIKNSSQRVSIEGFNLETPHGTIQVSDEAAHQIANEVIRKSIKRVVLAEVHGLPQFMMKTFDELGIEVVELDHHKRGRVDFSHRHSVLEQLAWLINYQLTLGDYLVALRDRAGLSGLTDAGITDRNTLLAYLSRSRGLAYAESVRDCFEDPFDNDRDVVALVCGASESLNALSMGMSLFTFPRVANIITSGERGTAFSGDPWMAQDIRREVLRRQPYGVAIETGDGKHASTIWFRRLNQEKALRDACRAVNANASGALQNPCVREVIRKSRVWGEAS